LHVNAIMCGGAGPFRATPYQGFAHAPGGCDRPFSGTALSAIIGSPEHARQVAALGALIRDQSRLTYNRRDVHHFVHHSLASRARRSTHAFAYRFVGHSYTPLRQGSFESNPSMHAEATRDESIRCERRRRSTLLLTGTAPGEWSLRWFVNRRTPALPDPGVLCIALSRSCKRCAARLSRAARPSQQ
jgi:hypothetical protein